MVKKLTLFGFLVVVLLSVSLYYMSQDGQFEGDSFLISFSDSLNYHDDAKIIVMDQNGETVEVIENREVDGLKHSYRWPHTRNNSTVTTKKIYSNESDGKITDGLDQVVLFNHDLGTEEVVLSVGLKSNSSFTCPRISPDSTKIIFSYEEIYAKTPVKGLFKSGIYVYDLVNETIASVLSEVPLVSCSSTSFVRWLDDESIVLFSKTEDQVYAINIVDKSRVSIIETIKPYHGKNSTEILVDDSFSKKEKDLLKKYFELPLEYQLVLFGDSRNAFFGSTLSPDRRYYFYNTLGYKWLTRSHRIERYDTQTGQVEIIKYLSKQFLGT